MKMFLKGDWVERDERIDVVNPYSGDVFDTVPEATSADVTEAVDGLVQMREPGSWMYHCHIYDHIAGGMTSMLTVLPAGFEGDPVAFCRYGGAQ